MPVHVSQDRDSLANHAAFTIAKLLNDAPGPRVSLGLAGGSTPELAYHQLRWESVHWDRVVLWLSDERWVPHDHEDSNGRMALESLASNVPARFVRPRWSEYLTAEDAAAYYDADLRSVIDEGVPDVLLLGMGDDGHTASLFPGTDALEETTRWFVGNEVPDLDTWRLTVTPPFIKAADNIVVIVAGPSKAKVIAEVLEGPREMYPIQILLDAPGTVWWLIDRDAASSLVSTTFETV